MKKYLIFSVIVVWNYMLALGQPDLPNSGPRTSEQINPGEEKQEAAFLIPENSWSIAYGLANEMLPEGYRYAPLTLLGRFRLMPVGLLEFYAESQVSQAASLTGEETNYELGMNFGFSYRLVLNPQLAFSAAVGSGPHYITVETDRQANGFIFSDNFEMGASYYGRRLRTAIHLKGRFRHISNAGLEEPNGGIDNLFLVLGITRQF